MLLAGAAIPTAAYGQCVTDRFAVDACLGGVRINGPSLPPGVTLDLNFMNPGTLDPRITFTRASSATYIDASGVIQMAAVNAPRWDYDPVTHALRGVLIEEARTNLLLNSATLNTQSVAVTAQSYVLSFYGTGTVTKSGAATGALVGTGVTQRVSQTFTPTAGALICTVTGSVTNAQLEAGSFVTSLIPTTSAAVTRAADLPVITGGGWFSSAAGSWMAEIITFDNDGNPRRVIQVNIAGNNPTPMFLDGGTRFIGQWNTGSVLEDSVIALPNTIIKAATTAASGGVGKICTNGGAVVSGAIASGGYPTGDYALFQTGTPNFSSTGYIRRVSYWNRVLSDAEMRQVTT